MDSSDKEIIKDNLPGGKQESDKLSEPSEDKEIEEICQNGRLIPETPVCTQVKQKSQLQLENRQKLSTDLFERNSKNYEEQLSTENSPCNKKGSIEEYSEQADQNACKQKNIKPSKKSKLKDITASIHNYVTKDIDSEVEIIKSGPLENTVDEIKNYSPKCLENHKEAIPYQQNVPCGKSTSRNALDLTNFQIYVSNEDDTKRIDENVLEKEHNKLSKFSESENNEDKLLTFTVTTGGKKYEEIVEDEIKRKRSAHHVLEVSNDENVTDNLNLLDSALYTGDSETHFVNTVTTDNSTQACVKEQYTDKAANWTHQSANKHIVTETTAEIDYDTYNHQTANNEPVPDQTQSNDKSLLLEDLYRDLISSLEHGIILPPFKNLNESGTNNLQNEITHELASESIDSLKDSKKDNIAEETLIKFQDFIENPESELPKNATEDKPVNHPCKTSNTNTNDSCDVPLQMHQNSTDTSISDIPNIRKILEHAPSDEYLPPQGIIGDTRGRIARSSPVKLFSDAECDLNRVYNEPESKFINLEQMQNDQEFVDFQKQIHESLNSQRQISSIKPDSDDELKLSEPLENKDPNKVDPEVPKDAPYRVSVLLEMIALMLKTKGEGIRDIDELILITLLIELASNYDPDVIPYIVDTLMKRQTGITRSQVTKNVTRDRSAENNLNNNDRVLYPEDFSDKSVDKYLRIINHRSPDSSPPKNKPDETSEKDLCELKEYPGLARDLKTVKKDARYQKKFYKENKPVLLPKNWSGEGSSCKIKLNTNSELNEIQSIGDDLQVSSEHNEDIDHEEIVREENSQEDPILLNNAKLLKEKIYEDTVSPQEPIKVKKDSRYLKKYYKQKPVLPISCSVYRGSEIEQNIDSNKNKVQKINNQPIASKNNEDCIYEESKKGPKILLEDDHVFKEKGKTPEDNLSETSTSPSNYKIGSVEEEPSNSSQTTSPKRSNECKAEQLSQSPSSQAEQLSQTNID